MSAADVYIGGRGVRVARLHIRENTLTKDNRVFKPNERASDLV